MSYCTAQQLIDQFSEVELIQLTDRPDPETGATENTLDYQVLDSAIVKAAKRVEGYISPRYTLPLSQSMIDSSSLSEMTGYIVRKILYDDAPIDVVIDDYKDALTWLRDVQAGRVSLGEQDTETTDTGRIVQKSGVSKHNWDAY